MNYEKWPMINDQSVFLSCNSGYYDMATPYYAVDYTLSHISIDPKLLKNFSSSYYEAGHMMYIDEKSLIKLHADVERFMQDSMTR